MSDLNHCSIPEDLPCCAGHATSETLIVSSGQWERQFFQCSSCGQAFAAAWRSAYYHRPEETVPGLRELAEAVA